MDIQCRIARFIPCLALLLALALPRPAMADELRLSVAASMTGVITELGAAFVAQHPETRLVPNFASSGALAKQLAAGALADIYIAANPKWMEFVVQQGIVPGAKVTTLAHNRLVVIGRSTAPVEELNDLIRLERIALCSPTSSPAGRYAQQALSEAGLYEALSADGKLITAKDVRQALLYADRGEVDAAFVYATDARLARQARTLLEVPAELYPQVSYPIGLTVAGADNEAARAFVDFLQGAPAREIFRRYGFGTPQ